MIESTGYKELYFVYHRPWLRLLDTFAKQNMGSTVGARSVASIASEQICQLWAIGEQRWIWRVVSCLWVPAHHHLISTGLQKNFPRLFGGGHAYLELTGEDLLDAGVNVIARPPGKRNSSIHLLSGGEKALTAVALVFSIFELNPAPFCMLDEVDAPLDDANIGRFCKLVNEMSQRVQFIFITHRKPTMEIAQHLSGVTMHEPGVSRLVAVDVDAAADMAAA